jgi:hypothetical protein
LENYKIKIKGLPNIIIRDFSREKLEPENNLGNLTAANITIVEITQAKYTQKVIKTKTKLICKKAKNNTYIKAGKVSLSILIII